MIMKALFINEIKVTKQKKKGGEREGRGGSHAGSWKENQAPIPPLPGS